MTEIRDEFIEAAATAIWRRTSSRPDTWDDLNDLLKTAYREMARAALAAVVPLAVEAEREAAAKVADHWLGPDSYCAAAIRQQGDNS